MLEVKLEGLRGVADKRRIPFDGTVDRAFVADTLLRAYHMDAPQPLKASAATSHRRTTLVSLAEVERITCDTTLVCSAKGRRVAMRPDLAVLEVKAIRGTTGGDRLLRSYGLRPIRISKYCLAVAVLYPEVSANPWHRALRLCFPAR